MDVRRNNSFMSLILRTNIFVILILEVVWILTRERFPSKSILDTADKILEVNKISKAYLATTDHSNCPAERMDLRQNIQKHSKSSESFPFY